MTHPAKFMSLLFAPRTAAPAERRPHSVSRRQLGVVELALPAITLRDNAIARWVRERSVAVEVRDGHELAIARSADVHPMRMTAHADGLSADELVFCSAGLGVGRVVVTTADHVDVLAATRRRQPVLMGALRRRVARAIFDCPTVDVVGIYRDVDHAQHHCVSYPSAVGAMLAEMSRIRRDHGVMLTRIALGGRHLTFGAGPGELSEVAAAVDETLDDACATLRFPRPSVVVSASPTV
ncbi:LysA protein [Mycolicibacterium goodii]|uniref:LysA protein n=1 Tax=Mycolicibacterium goodii TaxID=134601 RepID=UPI0006732F6D